MGALLEHLRPALGTLAHGFGQGQRVSMVRLRNMGRGAVLGDLLQLLRSALGGATTWPKGKPGLARSQWRSLGGSWAVCGAT